MVERYYTAYSPLETERQKVLSGALGLIYRRAAFRPQPVFPWVTMTVLPLSHVAADVGVVSAWPVHVNLDSVVG